MNTFHPTNIGFVPTGAAGVAQTSSVYIGRDISSTYDAIGFGANGRPDYVQLVKIPLTQRAADGTLTKQGTITLDVSALVTARSSNPNIPSSLELVLREVAVCDNGTNKRMMIVASATYAAPT